MNICRRCHSPISLRNRSKVLVRSQDGSQWVRTRTALLLWSQGRLRTWRAGRELPGTRVQSFLEDSRGSLWVGTDQGLVALPSARTADNGRLESLPALGANSILTMFEDREHNLWVGTDTTGLHVLQQQKFRTLPSLSGVPITAITQTADWTVWLGSRDGGLFRYESGKTAASLNEGWVTQRCHPYTCCGSRWFSLDRYTGWAQSSARRRRSSHTHLPMDCRTTSSAPFSQTMMELSGSVHVVALLIANKGNSPSFPVRMALRVI